MLHPTTRYGLVGYPLGHSFSPGYFAEKFAREGIAARYDRFEMPDLRAFPALWAQYPDLRGVNVTIPHKRAVIPYLDDLDDSAARVGAVNVVRRTADGRLVGYNTDVYGFRVSLADWLGPHRPATLVLGTGGAAQAVVAALAELGVAFRSVSRRPDADQWPYTDVTPAVLNQYRLLINTTPLGMHPHLDETPPLPYAYLTAEHWLYDLIYNPPITAFLARGQAVGAATHNGLAMLHLQAEKSWEIWQG